MGNGTLFMGVTVSERKARNSKHDTKQVNKSTFFDHAF